MFFAGKLVYLLVLASVQFTLIFLPMEVYKLMVKNSRIWVYLLPIFKGASVFHKHLNSMVIAKDKSIDKKTELKDRKLQFILIKCLMYLLEGYHVFLPKTWDIASPSLVMLWIQYLKSEFYF